MLKREIGITFAGSMASTVLSIGSAIILARFLGPSNRGLLALALLIPSIAGTFCRLGQDTVNATFAGLYKDQRSSLFLQSVVVAVLGGLVSVLAVVAFFFWLPIERGQFAKLSPAMVFLVCLVAPVSILGALMGALVRGVGRITTAAKIRVAEAALRFALIGLFVAVLGYRLEFVVLLAVLLPLGGAALSIWIVRQYATVRPSQFSGKLFKKSMNFGSMVCLSTLAGFLVYRLDQGMLGYMVTATQVGLYVVAVGLAEKMKMLPGAITSAFLPRLANELPARQSQVPAVFRYALVVSIAAMLIAAVLGAPVILLLFGRAYTGSIVPFLILLPGIAALGGGSVLSSDLLAREKPKYSMVFGYSGLCVNVVLNLLLIPAIGIAGAALASSITYMFTCSLALVFYRRESGVRIGEMIPRWRDVAYVWASGWGLIRRRGSGRRDL